ncbi:hypothetical protein M0812_09007 [Anaeramoeba flamelloides]|uniref:Integrator complex subunit 4/Protein SIEL C-terminal Ig-like domain-containing protein n=1 Tax=Anaeramoeba flamelloides TaxID=1746091 RepID=A0AAV7ZRT8_9EUKA|nr:hypothetical protein M0812_09007 [Anaeramoeba flamelloides]
MLFESNTDLKNTKKEISKQSQKPKNKDQVKQKDSTIKRVKFVLKKKKDYRSYLELSKIKLTKSNQNEIFRSIFKALSSKKQEQLLQEALLRVTVTFCRKKHCDAALLLTYLQKFLRRRIYFGTNILVRALVTISTILERIPRIRSSVCEELITVCREFFNKRKFRIRRAVLQLLSEMRSEEYSKEIHGLICSFSKESDPRLNKEVLQALLSLVNSKVDIDKKLTQEIALRGINSMSSHTRLLAVTLLGSLARQSPTKTQQDLFKQISKLIIDPQPFVRTQVLISLSEMEEIPIQMLYDEIMVGSKNKKNFFSRNQQRLKRNFSFRNQSYQQRNSHSKHLPNEKNSYGLSRTNSMPNNSFHGNQNKNYYQPKNYTQKQQYQQGNHYHHQKQYHHHSHHHSHHHRRQGNYPHRQGQTHHREGQGKGIDTERDKQIEKQEKEEQPKEVSDKQFGIFVQGLEDEKKEVRLAALDAIETISERSIEFGKRSINYVVYMIGDEIDQVRVQAINCLYKITSATSLTYDRLVLVLTGLGDTSPQIRRSIRNLIKTFNQLDIKSLNFLIDSLLLNLKLYPMDELEVYQALAVVGSRNPDVVEILVLNLLMLNTSFMTHEPNPDNGNYLARLILVLNSAVSNKKILQLLPDYIFRHYQFLKDKYKDCFPNNLEPNGREPNRNKNDYGKSKSLKNFKKNMNHQIEKNKEGEEEGKEEEGDGKMDIEKDNNLINKTIKQNVKNNRTLEQKNIFGSFVGLIKDLGASTTEFNNEKIENAMNKLNNFMKIQVENNNNLAITKFLILELKTIQIFYQLREDDMLILNKGASMYINELCKITFEMKETFIGYDKYLFNWINCLTVYCNICQYIYCGANLGKIIEFIEMSLKKLLNDISIDKEYNNDLDDYGDGDENNDDSDDCGDNDNDDDDDDDDYAQTKNEDKNFEFLLKLKKLLNLSLKATKENNIPHLLEIIQMKEWIQVVSLPPTSNFLRIFGLLSDDKLTTTEEKPYRLMKGFPINLELRIEIFNYQKSYNDLSIRAIFPDQKVEIFKININELGKQNKKSNYSYNCVKKIVITRKMPWSEVCSIKFGLLCGQSLISEELSVFLKFK